MSARSASPALPRGTRALFAALVLGQAAHSVEEYAGRLWESFPPARFITGIVASDREVGFLIVNVALVTFGLWCWLWPVRREWRSARMLVWVWIVIELINGVGHPLWSMRQGGYTPGVLSAAILLVLSLMLATRMIGSSPQPSLGTHSGWSRS